MERERFRFVGGPHDGRLETDEAPPAAWFARDDSIAILPPGPLQGALYVYDGKGSLIFRGWTTKPEAQSFHEPAD